MTGSYITRDQCDLAFERMHARDRIGDRIHLVLACVAMIGIAGPVSFVDFLVMPLVAFFLIRVVNTFPIWIHGFGQPVVLVGLMLAGLMGLSLLWSADPVAGLEHIGELRWLAMIGFVYPVIEHRRVLIACLCIGFVIGNGVQVIDAFDGFGNAWLADRLWHEPGRVSGWWDPAVGGSILVAALGLHLPAAVMGRGRGRVVGFAGSMVTIVALMATGTRGGWIAAVVLVMIALLIAGFQRRRRFGPMMVGGAMLVVVISALVVVKGGALGDRIGIARDEIRMAIDGDVGTSTGARISMGHQAVRAGLAHPVGGLGAGGFRSWMEEETVEVLDDQAHPHSSMLRLWSEHGLPGVLIGVLLASVLLVNAWRCVPSGDRGTYLMGPFFAVLGLILVSGFDSVLINVNTMAMMGVLGALCPAYCPRIGSER
ncbi:MAG: O-antigen ligase family protein [Phycisphaerales bacterium]|nr:O-antigen ligase family protein [Phycisphaerales bacterium]